MRVLGRLAVALTALALLPACGDGPSALDPKGPGADRIAQLWWVMFALGTAVYVLVLAVLFLAIRSSRRNGGEGAHRGDGNRLVMGGGVILPAVVLIPLIFLTLRVGDDLAFSEGDDHLAVEVVGHQFWWEIRYLPDGPVTANELHVPVGRTVDLTLGSSDVIHSFWVPQLSGKMDLIPGEATELQIRADEPGTYRGICAEFCGIQHAHMQFLVVAEPQEAFDEWLARERQDAEPPATDQGREGERLFQDTGCGACHTVRGTAASGTVGPDLTHVGTRRTLAAATIENTPANLELWIDDPQGVKPGNLMPPVPLAEGELAAVVAYLDGLR